MMNNNFDLPGSGGLVRHGNEEEINPWDSNSGFDYTDGEDYQREFSVESPILDPKGFLKEGD